MRCLSIEALNVIASVVIQFPEATQVYTISMLWFVTDLAKFETQFSLGSGCHGTQIGLAIACYGPKHRFSYNQPKYVQYSCALDPDI